ncbi:YDG domain-containing protein [Pseudomonas putida]|uniref:Heme/hemopexin-binding protein n=1 Tax=Pseudomonas putida TaxID=303 RepID=A0A1Q9R8F8_PSEPU|nr:YDG domain-containing protein [Pseudomonas putida]OLS63709.1 Heme/hemopexin-binding protein precursor [Pseudomonas putida]
MNRTYALVWNPNLGDWSVADEHARRRGKGAGAVLAAILLLPALANAADLPTGGQVTAGQGQIGLPANNQMVIDQASNKLAIDWQSFDIAAGNKVTFNQPGRDSVALNRVLGADGSKIMGQLDANGRVFIVNPNGVLFGKDAQVNVGGLVASTLDISNRDFEAGNYAFKGNGKNAAVVNNGKISATDGGSVALLGGTVSNNGVIVANQGSVALAAGNAVTLDFAGDGLLNVQVDEAVVDALVENHQLIKADGGQVLLTANAGDVLINTVVNNTGTIEAQTVGEKNGKIVLLGSFDGGSVQVAGTLDASAASGGNGGFVETSGAHVKVADSAKVTTLAQNGKTGTWLIDPTDFTVSAGGTAKTDSGMGADTLSINLASTDVTLQTVATNTGAEPGDIHVNAAVTWNAGTPLTLSAHNNININAAITARHANGKVALKYGQASISGGTADYNLKAPINLQSGLNFSTQKGLAGNTFTYNVVNDAQALQAINDNRHGNYAVGSYIDLGSISNWVPVGTWNEAFVGRLVGLGHTLSNLTIDRSGTDNVGLVGYADSGSVIRDIGLVGGSVTGGNTVGGLIGVNQATVSNVFSTATVNGQAGVGGLVGINDGPITNAYAAGSVTGQNSVGGLVGVNRGIINNAYATGNVTGQVEVGGLVGSNEMTVRFAYATGLVQSGDVFFGGLVGSNTVFGFVGESNWDSDSTGSAKPNFSDFFNGVNVSAVTSSNRYNHSSYGNLGTWSLVAGTGNVYTTGANGWIMIEGQTRPFLASEYSTSVGNDHQLQLMAYSLGASYTLARDIDASATAGSNASGMWSTAGFVSVGDTGNRFTGQLDGGSHAVTGLTINRTGTDSVGLFGYTNVGSVIRNIGLVGATVVGNNDVGGLVGRSYSALSNVYVTGSVTGNSNVGGLVGSSGGLINSAYAAVAVNGNSSVGGLAGYSEQNVINTYASGNVTGGAYVGGLIGFNGARIDDSFATGSVSGTGALGGLAGLNNGGGVVARSFYATTDANGAEINNGGANTGLFSGNSLGTGKNRNQLTQASTFTGWSIATTGGSNAAWRIYDGYSGPLLRSLLKSVTVTVDDVTGKTYDGTSGTVAGVSHSLSDSSANLQGSASYSSVSTRNAGTYGLGLTGLYSDQQGYDIEVVEGSYVIGKASISAVTGITAQNRTYDGTTDVSLNTGSAGFTGRFGNDTLSVTSASAAFADKSAGDGKTVDITGIVLGGADAGNYTLADNTASTTADIAKASISGVTGITAQNRTYDGTTDATVNTGAAAFTGRFGNDELSVASASGAFTDKNAGDGKTVNIDNIVLGGADAGNYTLADSTASTTADIAKASISGVTGITAQNRTYDGTTAAGLNTGAAAFTGRFGNDELSVSSASGTFADKNAGNGKAVDITGIVLGGADAGNYTLADNTATSSADIAKASISGVTGITAQNRTYDGTADTTLNTGAAAFTGRFGNDELSVASASGAFTDKNAGDGKTVNIDNVVLGGADAGNYTLADSTASTTADIAKASISGVTGITAQNRTYDGTTAAGLNTGTAAFTGRFGNDELSVTSAGGAFIDKNAGDGKTVNIDNIVLGGADAGNYSLADSTASTTADIAKASISGVTGITAQNRTYDGTTAAGLNTGAAAFTGRFGNDELSVASASGAFTDKNAGDGKTVNIDNIVLGGADAGNYTLADNTASTTADIAKASISGVTGITAQNRTYDGTTAAGLNTGAAAFTGRFGNDELSVASASGAFTDKNAGDGKTVNIDNIVLGGADAGNYTLADNTATSSADIAKASISGVTGITAQNRTYDGTTAAGLNTGAAAFTGRFGNDELSVSSASGTFADKNAGNGKTVDITGIVLGGADAGNYTLADNTATSSADIAKASISGVTGITAQNRTYDGTTDATVNTGAAAFTGRFGNDELSVASASGAFADKNAGAAKSVAIIGITLGGADAGNYVLASDTSSTQAAIARAALTIAADDAAKIAGQSIVLNGYSSRGLVAGDSVASVSLASSGEAASAAAGSHAIVASAATGADLSNYTIRYENGILFVLPALSEPSLPVMGQDYLGVQASNGQIVSSQATQEASEPQGLSHDLLITNPSDERLNLHVVNQGIRLPEGI